MALLNYTTTIDALKTAGEIEYILAKHGARQVVKDYDEDGHVVSMNFIIITSAAPIPVKLPVNAEPVYRVLLEQKRNRQITGTVTMEQAYRVAWRILKDWVEAQMAILETDMVKFTQIFLPYIMDKSGHTLFEVMERSHFMLGAGDV